MRLCEGGMTIAISSLCSEIRDCFAVARKDG